MVVVPADLRVFRRHLVDGALPQVTGEGEHVRLVHQREVVSGPAPRQLEGEAHAALHTHAGVDRTLCGHFARGALTQKATLAGVGALGVLANHHEVGAVGHRTGHRHEGSQVDVEIELEAQA